MKNLLEELSFNAWPALQTVYYDGWLLRFAEGYTRRANSVNPIYPSSLPVQEKIACCEALYAARRQDVVFKISPAVHPEDLDMTLDRLSYRRQALTSVQTRDLHSLDRVTPPPSVTMEWGDAPTEEWLSAFCALSGIPAGRRPTMARMLAGIVPAAAFAALKHAEEVVAVGLAVREREWVGLFDLVTAASWRRRGLGTHLISSLLYWGRQAGAHRAYLQVMLDNPPALGLYGRFGFSESYRYWYRVKAISASNQPETFLDCCLPVLS